MNSMTRYCRRYSITEPYGESSYLYAGIKPRASGCLSGSLFRQTVFIDDGRPFIVDECVFTVGESPFIDR